MPDQTLAQRIKAKYPGEYDDIPDSELETKIKAKYPGEYDDLPTTSVDKSLPKTEGILEKTIEPIKKAWDFANTPLLPEVGEFANKFAQEQTDPRKRLDKFGDVKPMNPYMSYSAGATAGAGDVVSGLSTPLNLGLTALSGGEYGALRAGFPQIARALSIGTKALSAPIAASGAIKTFSPKSSLVERLMGVGEMAGGGAGMLHTPVPKVKVPTAEVPPPPINKGVEVPQTPFRPLSAEAQAASVPITPEIPKPSVSPREEAAIKLSRLFGDETPISETPVQAATKKPEITPFTSEEPIIHIKPAQLSDELISSLKERGYKVDLSQPLSSEGFKYLKSGVPKKTLPDVPSPFETPKVSAPSNKLPHAEATLPNDLKGAKARYNIGQKSWMPIFENDIEKSLFIIAKETPSKRDADYLKFVMKTLGIDAPTARRLGRTVKGRLKEKFSKLKIQGDVETGPLLTADDLKGFPKALEPAARVTEQAGIVPPISETPIIPKTITSGVVPPPIIPPTSPTQAPIPIPPKPSILSKAKTLAGTVKENLLISGQRQLEKMGPVGKNIAKALGDNETAASTRGGRYASQLHEIAEGLSKVEQDEVSRLIAGHQIPNPSPKVTLAYNEVKNLINTLGSEEAGAGKAPLLEGTTKPFEKFTAEYLPRTAKGKFVETLFESYKADKNKFQNELIKSGMSKEEAFTHLKQLDLKGEDYLRTDKGSKLIKQFEHELSFNTLEQYLYETARETEMANRFGKDMFASDSSLSKMIESLPIESQKQARDIVDIYMGKGEAPSRNLTRAAGMITNVEVAAKLKNFVVNNFNDLTGTVRDAGVKRTIKSISKAIFDSKKLKKEATKSGAFELFHHNLIDDPTFGTKVSKLYGLEKVETFIRKIAAHAGRATVESRLAEFKKNPTNKVIEKELSHFLEHDPSDYIGDNPKRKISSEDLDFASGRFVELTSGKPNVLKLPPAFFAKNPLARLPLLFKRFAFVQSKNMLDSFKRSYVPGDVKILGKNLPSLTSTKALGSKAARTVAAAITLGELTGDTVAGLRAMIDPNEDVIEAIKNRGNVRERLLADMMQSWLFGMIGDAASAGSSGIVSGLKYIVGPVGSDVADIAYGGAKALEGKYGPIRNWIARNIPVPFIGSGVGRLLATSDEKKSKYGPDIPKFQPQKSGR